MQYTVIGACVTYTPSTLADGPLRTGERNLESSQTGGKRRHGGHQQHEFCCGLCVYVFEGRGM